RLVAVVGAPGVGKTALVERWLAGARAAGSNHQSVAAGAARTAEELVAKIAAALGIPVPAGSGDPLARVLAARPLVLFLDGVDGAADAVAACAPAWLAAAPDLSIVATSGVPTGAAGEAVVRIAPLAREDAVALFEARATQVGWRSKRTPDEARAVQTLAERLDGLPLALELAAARAPVLSPKQMIERIERGLGLLDGRDASGATVSLRAAFALSWSLLERSSRDLLAAASVLSGSFSIDTIEALLPDLSADVIATALDDVVRRSLAEAVPGPDDEMRFRLLSTVRAFARSELDASERTDATSERADRFTVELAEGLAKDLESSRESVSAARLFELSDDLSAAIQRSLSRDPILAARGAIAFAAFAAPRGCAPVALLGKALIAAKRTADHGLVARLEYGISRAVARIGMVDEARANIDDAIVRCETSGDDSMRARALIERGKQRLQRGDFSGARSDLDLADSILGDVDDPYAAGMSSNERGRLEEAVGALDASARSFIDARSRFRHAGSVRMHGIALQNLGVVRLAQGRLEEARSIFEEALELHQMAHDPASAADNLLNTVSVHLALGRLDRAEDVTIRALEEERRLGNRRFEGLALGNLALIAHERGSWQVAFDRYQRTLTLFRETGDTRFASVFMPFLAACEATLGLDRESQEDFEAARKAYEAMGDPGNHAVLDALLGIADLHPGADAAPRLDAATARLERAEAELTSASEAARTPELLIAVRLLRAAISHRSGTEVTAPAAPDVASRPRSVLLLGPDVRWFQLDGPRANLAASAAPRRILALLVEHRLRAPGVGLSQQDLFAAGWPGQKVAIEAARGRVYTAVRTLRRLGLEPILLRQDDGYLLDPGVRLETAPS
ncbi:MAG: tetratricopeptide repeat protein, partial [Polyangiaceae bacterium]|nr:tetratricopeptide repeat protein [Polyangiaceae bacterium]